MAITGKPASVLARLRNQAKDEGISFQLALQLFCQEEFLRRLALSKYRDNLVLKGGMFIYTLTAFDSRPTQDKDFMLRNLSGDSNHMEAVMREICDVRTDNDYILLEVLGAEQISVDKKYPGIRTKFLGRIENIRVPFSVDVGVDDLIVPDAVLRNFTTRLPDFSALPVYTYSLESTIAEKFDAILARMETTSRMKDFYDIYYLSGLFDFDGALLTEALKGTLSHRNRTIPENALERIHTFRENRFMQTQWQSFPPAKEAGLSMEAVLAQVLAFVGPVFEAVQAGTDYNMRWMSTHLEWRRKIPMSHGVPDADCMTSEELAEVLQAGLDSAKNGQTYTLEEVREHLRKMLDR